MNINLPLCPVETTLSLISNKWKVIIIRDLLDGSKRFGELKKTVGNITQKVLTSNLREMEASGLLTRKVYAEVPPRVEYTLTETGLSLRPVLDAMTEWGNSYKKKNKCFLNLFVEGHTAFTRNKTKFIYDKISLVSFISIVKIECESMIDTVVVDDLNVSDTFFEILSEANELLTSENIKLVIIKPDLKRVACKNCKNIIFAKSIDEIM